MYWLLSTTTYFWSIFQVFKKIISTDDVVKILYTEKMYEYFALGSYFICLVHIIFIHKNSYI